MKRTKGISLAAMILMFCSICASSAFAAYNAAPAHVARPAAASTAARPAANTVNTAPAAANAAPVAITAAPSTYPLQAGRSGTFAVSFSGTGIQPTVQISGIGLSARILNTTRQPNANTYTSNIDVAAASNFQGGTVVFQLLNGSRNVIKSQTIAIQAIPNSTANAVNSTRNAVRQNTNARYTPNAANPGPTATNIRPGANNPANPGGHYPGNVDPGWNTNNRGLTTTNTRPRANNPVNSVSNPGERYSGNHITQTANTGSPTANTGFTTTNTRPGTSNVATPASIAANAGPAALSVPATHTLIAGTHDTFNVSYSGTGNRVTAKASGTGLSAAVMASSGGMARINVTAGNNFTGGTVTVSLLNSGGGVIQSQAVPITLMNLGNSAPPATSPTTTVATPTTAVTTPTTAVATPATIAATPATTSTFSATPVTTSAVVSASQPNTSLPSLLTRTSQANSAISQYQVLLQNTSLTADQRNQYQTCVNLLTPYKDQARQANVGFASDPGPLPSCGTAILTGNPIVTPPTTTTVSRATVAKNNGWTLTSNLNPADPALPASNSDQVAITTIDPYVEVGKPTTLPVTFGSGSGAYHAEAKPSAGADFTASLSTVWNTYPTPSKSTITITPQGNKGGTITFTVHNSAGRVIGSKVINVAINNTAQTTTATGSQNQTATAFDPRWPTTGYQISCLQYYKDGTAHSTRYQKGTGKSAIDIAVKTGTQVFAAESGKVRLEDAQTGGFGNYVIIEHNSGKSEESLYAHLSKILVANGQQVARGDVIALSGESGNATGAPHLHFELSKSNPWKDYYRSKYLNEITYQQNVYTNNNPQETKNWISTYYQLIGSVYVKK